MPKTSAALDRFITNSTSFSPVKDRIGPQIIYQPEGKHDEKKPYKETRKTQYYNHTQLLYASRDGFASLSHNCDS